MLISLSVGPLLPQEERKQWLLDGLNEWLDDDTRDFSLYSRERLAEMLLQRAEATRKDGR